MIIYLLMYIENCKLIIYLKNKGKLWFTIILFISVYLIIIDMHKKININNIIKLSFNMFDNIFKKNY